jgi:hypothetical protein
MAEEVGVFSILCQTILTENLGMKWQIHRNNAPAHSAQLGQQFLANTEFHELNRLPTH